MLNSSVLDVAIGLVFVYLILALLCTALNEWWSGQRRLRSKLLEKGVYQLLGNNTLIKAFYDSHLIQSITGPEGHPSYISPKLFAQAMVEVLQKLPGLAAVAPSVTASETVQGLVERMPEGPTKNALRAVLIGANDTSEAALEKIAVWFEDSMDRVSGWYKRRIQFITLIMAALLTLFTNADTLQIVHRLWNNPTLRAAVVARAQERAKQPSKTSKAIDVEYRDPSPVATPPTKVSSEDADKSSAKILTEEEESTLGDLLSWSPELCEFNRRVSKGNSDAKPCVEVKGQWDSNLHVWSMVKNSGVLAGWLYWLISTNLIGWIITIYAISLGAPFWFGALQKIVNIRSAGDAPDEKKKISGNAS